MSKGGSLIKEVRIVYLKKNGRWPANGDGPRQQGPADYERVNFPPQFLTPAKQYLTLLWRISAPNTRSSSGYRRCW